MRGEKGRKKERGRRGGKWVERGRGERRRGFQTAVGSVFEGSLAQQCREQENLMSDEKMGERPRSSAMVQGTTSRSELDLESGFPPGYAYSVHSGSSTTHNHEGAPNYWVTCAVE